MNDTTPRDIKIKLLETHDEETIWKSAREKCTVCTEEQR